MVSFYPGFFSNLPDSEQTVRVSLCFEGRPMSFLLTVEGCFYGMDLLDDIVDPDAGWENIRDVKGGSIRYEEKQDVYFLRFDGDTQENEYEMPPEQVAHAVVGLEIVSWKPID